MNYVSENVQFMEQKLKKFLQSGRRFCGVSRERDSGHRLTGCVSTNTINDKGKYE
jgi:hypothetical protein